MPGPTRDRGHTLREHEEEPDRQAPTGPPDEEAREAGSDVEGNPEDARMAADEERGLTSTHRTGLPAELGEGDVEH